MSENLFVEPCRPSRSIFIFIIVILIATACTVLSHRQYIMSHWDDYKCNPLVMASAPLYKKKFYNNTKECLTNFFKTELEGELTNIKDKISDMNDMQKKTTNKMSNMNQAHNSTKGIFSGLLQNVNNIFVNLLINIKKDAIKGKSMIHKFAGVVTTIMYVIQGAGSSGSSFINGPIYKIMTKLGTCFKKDVKFKLKNGEIKKIYKLKLNDVLENGSVVHGLVKLNNTYKEPFYTFKYDNSIFITGSHLIHNELTNKFIKVEKHPHAIQTDRVDNIVYSLLTSDHLIKLGHYTFWDYND